MIGTGVMIGAPTGTVAAMTETEETTVATTGTAGMGIVATTEEMIVVIVTTTAAASATAEMTMTGEMMAGGRTGEVQKRRRRIGMEKKEGSAEKVPAEKSMKKIEEPAPV